MNREGIFTHNPALKRHIVDFFQYFYCPSFFFVFVFLVLAFYLQLNVYYCWILEYVSVELKWLTVIAWWRNSHSLISLLKPTRHLLNNSNLLPLCVALYVKDSLMITLY